MTTHIYDNIPTDVDSIVIVQEEYANLAESRTQELVAEGYSLVDSIEFTDSGFNTIYTRVLYRRIK